MSQGIGDIYLAAYSSAGSSLWNTTIGGSGDEGTGALATDPWDNLVLGGFFNSPTLTCTADTLVNTGQSDLFIGKLKKEVILTGLNSSALDHEISIYPNPSTGLVTLSAKVTITEVRVYNSNGMEVLREVDPVQEIDLSSLPRGVYFVRIDSGQSTRSRKILLM